MFIVFEGIDASGKGTQTEKAVEYIRKSFSKCAALKYPNRQTPVGKVIDKWLNGKLYFAASDTKDSEGSYPLILQSLLLVNKLEVQPMLRHKLDKGHVVADRYWPSGIAYGRADGLSMDWLMETSRELIQPDLIILLDIPVAESFKRRPIRQELYEKNEERLEEARKTYLQLADSLSSKWLLLNGMESPDRLSLMIQDAIDCLYQEGL